jgi:hypothetical protein
VALLLGAVSARLKLGVKMALVTRRGKKNGWAGKKHAWVDGWLQAAEEGKVEGA